MGDPVECEGGFGGCRRRSAWRSFGPYWRARDWRHGGNGSALRGRRAGSFGVPIYVRWGALFYAVVLVALLAGCVYDGGVYAAFGSGLVAAMVLGVGLHEVGHAAAARRSDQTVEGAMIGLWGAAVVWGSAGEWASPRDVAGVAAAGPAVNAGLAAVALIAALFTRGDVRVFFAVQVAVNLLFLAVNSVPLRARSKVGQQRIGTDGAIVVRALQASWLGHLGCGPTASPLKLVFESPACSIRSAGP